MIKVCAVSDLHGYLPAYIEESDVLLIAGDIFPLNIQRSFDESKEWFMSVFKEWVEKLPVQKVLFIAGNHDFFLEQINPVDLEILVVEMGLQEKLIYLEDTAYEYKGISVYGCPWCTGPFGWAFSPSIKNTDTFISDRYHLIPSCDILLTHQPPKAGKLGCSYIGKPYERDFGSEELLNVIKNRDIHSVVCGHIHSGKHGGLKIEEYDTLFYNVSLKDEDYHVSYQPTYLIIDKNK